MKRKIIGWMMAILAVTTGLILPINSYAVTRVATNLEKFDETGFLVTRINPGDNTITVLLKDASVKHVVLLMRADDSQYQEWEFDISSDLLLPMGNYDWGETMLLNFGTEGFPLNTELKMKIKDGVSLVKQGTNAIFYYGASYHNGAYKVGKIGFEDCMREILENVDSLNDYECRISFEDPGLYYISDDETQFLSPATLDAMVVRDEEGAPVAAQMQYKYTKELAQDDSFDLPGETEVWEDYFAKLDGAEKVLERLGLKTSDEVLREEAEAAAARAEEELNLAQRELNFLRTDRDTLIREMDGLWQQIVEIEDENMELNTKVQELERLKNALEEKKIELENLNRLLEEKTLALETENTSLLEDKTNLALELEKTKEELGLISEEFDIAMAKIDENVEKIKNAKAKMEELGSKIEETNTKFEMAVEKMNAKLEAVNSQFELASAGVKQLETASKELTGLKEELLAALSAKTVEVVKVNEKTVEKEKVETGLVNNYNYNYDCDRNGLNEVGSYTQPNGVPELGEEMVTRETTGAWWILIPLTAIGTFVGCWWLLPDWHLKHKRK